MTLGKYSMIAIIITLILYSWKRLAKLFFIVENQKNKLLVFVSSEKLWYFITTVVRPIQFFFLLTFLEKFNPIDDGHVYGDTFQEKYLIVSYVRCIFWKCSSCDSRRMHSTMLHYKSTYYYILNIAFIKNRKNVRNEWLQFFTSPNFAFCLSLDVWC